MALFKVNRGGKNSLVNQLIQDGFCWYTPEDGKFYIDAVSDVDSTTNLLTGATYTDNYYLIYDEVNQSNTGNVSGKTSPWSYTSNFITVDSSSVYVASGLINQLNSGTPEDWHGAALLLYDASNNIQAAYPLYLNRDLVFGTSSDTAYLKTSLRTNAKETATIYKATSQIFPRSALSAIPVSYGVCAANSNFVIIPGISLQNGTPPVGAMICVNFADANNGSTKNLIVNNGYINSSSIPIKTAAGVAGTWQAGAIVALVYNGTNWIIQSNNLLENRFNTAIDDTSLSYSVLFSEEQASNNTNSHEAQILQKTSSFKHYPVSGKTATNSLALGDEHVLLEYNSSSQTLNFVFN